MENEERRVFLDARGLVKTYPGVVALDGANFIVHEGEVLGLVGKNGAGKSTLIKVLAGAVIEDEGTLMINGANATIRNPQQAARLGLAFVHQELADIPNLTVAENIELGLGFPRRLGVLVDKRELRRRAGALLRRLESDIDPSAVVSDLSVVERRLVMIARGLAANARLLVLDEPSASLTDDEIRHLHKVVRSLRDHGVAVVYVSHRLNEILELTDSVVVMRDGRQVFAGSTSTTSRARLIAEIAGDAKDDLGRITHPSPGLHTEELIRTEHLTRRGHVEDVSIVVRRGEVLGIAGMVGSGRTELVRLLFGADHPTSGAILVKGSKISCRTPRDAMRAGIALLPEDRRHEGAVLGFSPSKNISLPSLSRFRRGGPGSPLPFINHGKERRIAKAYVERLDIKVSSVDSPVRHLSGGNQQKVILAKWLEFGAEVFIFDEPTAGIDVSGKNDVYIVMEELAAEGKGVIFISSDFAELVSVCSRVLVMREGRVVGQFQGAQVTEAALVESCYGIEVVEEA